MVSFGEGRNGGTSDLCTYLGNQGSRASEGQEGLEWPGQTKPVYNQPSSPFVVFWGKLGGSQCSGIKDPGNWLGVTGFEPIGHGEVTWLRPQT